MSRKVLLILAVSVGVVMFMTLMTLGMRYAREGARRAQCSNQLKYTVLALHNYHDTFDAMPPAGLIDHSWRVRLIPFLFASPYYETYRFEEPWNSEWNETLEFRYLPGKKSPDELTQEERDRLWKINPDASSLASYYWQCPQENDPKSTHTSYLMLVGSDAFGLPEQGRPLREIADGTTYTIAIAEYAGHDICWREPKDFDVETMSFQINDPDPGEMSISSHHPGGPIVCMADGTVRQLSPDLPPEVVKAMITINGGEKIVEDANAPGGYRLEQ